MGDYYDKEGKEITLEEWMALMERTDSKKEDGYYRIGYDEKKGIRISTVWLGMNHNHYLGGPPLIFETMIFGGEHDQYQERYSTLEEAQEGHAKACRMAGIV